MPFCNSDPDKVFRRFKVLEFPTTFVGLANTLELDLEIDASGPCYIRTHFQNSLLTFDEAREISSAHRAFTVTQIDKHTLQIMFKPTNECISKAIKMQKSIEEIDNRFIADLRAIKVDGFRCCNNVHHSEIGRYYICGLYIYCNISHTPHSVDFNVVRLKGRTVRTIRIHNDSHLPAKMTYIKLAGFDVTPRSFIIPSNSSKKVGILFYPNSHNVPQSLLFHIRNAYDPYTEPLNSAIPITDFNFIPYNINVQSIIKFESIGKHSVVKSLGTIWEPNPRLTYLNEELIQHQKRRVAYGDNLQFAKTMTKKVVIEKRTVHIPCYPEPPKVVDPKTTGNFFCKYRRPRINAPDLMNIQVLPDCLNFGKVGLNTYGEGSLLMKNHTKYEVDVKFMAHNMIVYTYSKHSTYYIKLQPMSETTVSILCSASILFHQEYTNTFTYMIDNKFFLQQLFKLEVGNPILVVNERILKFGMITSDYFVTHVSVRIHNHYNVPMKFEWQELPPDTPFEVFPTKGTVAARCYKVCDLKYIPKILKSKVYEVILFSKCDIKASIEFEVHIVTRKLAVKFLHSQVQFQEIPINIKTTEETKLENNCREIAVFRVQEPLIPGITVTPMEGIIAARALILFTITVQIACVLEFNFDLLVRLNNKETVGIPVYGKVVEPKIIVQPRNMIMPRLPCGMITYFPVKLQNSGPAKSIIEYLNTDDDNVFKLYIQNGNEKETITSITLEPGQSVTVFVKVYDVFRREYDQFLPLRVNNILGPPNEDMDSTEINYFTHEVAEIYENNPKVITKNLNKDIPYFRIAGVFTTPWISFSIDNFEIQYAVGEINNTVFEMRNVHTKYVFNVTIIISRLYPHFSIEVIDNRSDIDMDAPGIVNTDNVIKFELAPNNYVTITVYFHPQRQGRFVAVTPLYLDACLSTAYSNLTFIGKREFPELKASVFRVAFPPCLVGKQISHTFYLDMEAESDLDMFKCSSKEEPCVRVDFVNIEHEKVLEVTHTLVTVKVTARSDHPHSRNMSVVFAHDLGSSCCVEINFTFTLCGITLHTDPYVSPEDNPYPYYPEESQTTLYNYMERCRTVMEKWMYCIGFRRELFAEIPETFHSIAYSMIGKEPGTRKGGKRGISTLSFFKRIAGALMKTTPKFVYPATMDETLRSIREVHDTYEYMIRILRSRGATVPLMKAKFLLTYEQFNIYTSSERPKYVSEDSLHRFLKENEDMYKRLTKQMWFDFLLQCYKVFILESCLFDCVCINNEHRDIVKILINWYNEQINITQQCLHGKNASFKTCKTLSNITTDLMDGLAVMSSIYNHCSFLKDILSQYCEVKDNSQSSIVHNACLIVEALLILKVGFPLRSQDFLNPNFLQMLMLSVHLYVVLPMFRQKCVVSFNPPLLRTSVRALTISPSTPESLIFTYNILNNKHNSFGVEKVPGENSKKLYLNVKYFAKFVVEDQATLLVHCYNKARIFDTYMTFDLVGRTGALYPWRKCKVTAPLYRPIKVDISIHSPFEETVTFTLHLLETEPTIPMVFEEPPLTGFLVKRLKLMENEITLTGVPEPNQDLVEHKVHFFTYGLSTQAVALYLWFRSTSGEFFIKLTSQPRWDLPVDTQQVAVHSWPIDPCSCGEDCECYRTTVVNIPHHNELMLRALRFSLLDFATPMMMDIFDKLIDSETGKIIVMMLLVEGGTTPSEVAHILRSETTYHIFSRSVMPRLDRATLRIYSDAMLALPITLLPHETIGKFTITLTSQCNMDIRNYRFLITLIEEEEEEKSPEVAPKRSRGAPRRLDTPGAAPPGV